MDKTPFVVLGIALVVVFVVVGIMVATGWFNPLAFSIGLLASLAIGLGVSRR